MLEIPEPLRAVEMVAYANMLISIAGSISADEMERTLSPTTNALLGDTSNLPPSVAETVESYEQELKETTAGAALAVMQFVRAINNHFPQEDEDG